MSKRTKNNYYAFIVGSDRGLVRTWAECERRVSGKAGARFRGFVDRASAEAWLAGDAPRRPAPSSRPSRKVYAYCIDGEGGIVDSWSACEPLIRGRRGARYKGFADRAAAAAWLAAGARYEDRESQKAADLAGYPEDSVFFDAGTGGGRGTEVKVVDRGGAPVIHLAGDLPGTLTAEGSLLLGRGRTNNYGELLGCLLALRIADRLGSKHLFGDSRLVLDYWSKGHVTGAKRSSDPDLAVLADETARERRRFEDGGGRLDHVPGGLNPADLGFHRD